MIHVTRNFSAHKFVCFSALAVKEFLIRLKHLCQSLECPKLSSRISFMYVLNLSSSFSFQSPQTFTFEFVNMSNTSKCTCLSCNKTNPPQPIMQSLYTSYTSFILTCLTRSMQHLYIIYSTQLHLRAKQKEIGPFTQLTRQQNT